MGVSEALGDDGGRSPNAPTELAGEMADGASCRSGMWEWAHRCRKGERGGGGRRGYTARLWMREPGHTVEARARERWGTIRRLKPGG